MHFMGPVHNLLVETSTVTASAVWMLPAWRSYNAPTIEGPESMWSDAGSGIGSARAALMSLDTVCGREVVSVRRLVLNRSWPEPAWADQRHCARLRTNRRQRCHLRPCGAE